MYCIVRQVAVEDDIKQSHPWFLAQAALRIHNLPEATKITIENVSHLDEH